MMGKTLLRVESKISGLREKLSRYFLQLLPSGDPGKGLPKRRWFSRAGVCKAFLPRVGPAWLSRHEEEEERSQAAFLPTRRTTLPSFYCSPILLSVFVALFVVCVTLVCFALLSNSAIRLVSQWQMTF
uniref:Uncharacterized protein n=1 Tax=Sphaerodactylus townsendi TaxID=933632 RepID=A0ACB8EWU5_9SAUR